jgi:DnaK suppressor protein
MNIEEVKNKLLKEKEEVELLLNEINFELEKLKESDEFEVSDIAEKYEEKSDFYSKKEILEKRLENIKRALQKIENGTYGICIKCNNPIEEARLKIDPTTELCRKCVS